MIGPRVITRVYLFAHLLVTAGNLSAQEASEPLTLPLALHLRGATVEEALRAVVHSARVRVTYSSDLLPPSVRITIDRDRTTVGAALREILSGTELGIAVMGSGHIVVVRSELARPAGGAAEPSAVTAMRPQQMDRVIVMGTPVAGAPEREVTTAVAVVNARQIARARSSTIAEVFHHSVPGVVAWDLGSTGPIPQVGAVRGSSSFVANYLKAYLDGVELASPYMLFAIPTEAVERLEIIQGPQGSALYGSDAISGVAHAITKKGSFGGNSRMSAMASAGSVESSFADDRGISQQHALALEAGSAITSYSVSASRSVDGKYVTNGGASSTSALATGRALLGAVMIEGTARTTEIDYSAPVNPFLRRLLGVRTPPRLAAGADDQVIHGYTAGMTAMHEPTERWRQTLVVGYDRNVGALPPQRHAESVADALLGANDEDARRASVRYSLSGRAQVSRSIATMITAGIEHSRLVRERSGPRELIDGAAPSAAPSRSVTLYADTMNNTGAFTQWKADVGNALYVVAGVRGERNTNFGDGYGTAWAPMAGVSYVRDIERVTLKLRTAYGTGIRPPSPSARRALGTAAFRQLANPQLAPETQSGVEGGVDLYVGQTMALAITGFDQSADGLIQHVLPDPRIAPRTIQQQNVGRIANRGVELTARGQAEWLHGDVSYAGVRSTVKALSRFYTGDMRVGDRVPEVPAWTSAATVGATRGAVSLDVGVSLVGPWRGYDWLSYYGAQIAGTVTPSFRDYLVSYPAAARVRVVLARETASALGWFVRVENLTNEQRDSRDNLQITAGRTTWIGVSVATGR